MYGMWASSSPIRRIPCSTLAMISGSPSDSSMLKFSRYWSMDGRKGIDWPKEMQRPSSQVACSSAWARARRNSRRSLDLPIPASPAMNRTWPSAAALRAEHLEGPHRSVPLHGDLPQVQGLEEAAHHLMGGFADEDAPRPGVLLEARGKVRRVHHRRVVHPEVIPDAPDHDRPRVDPHPHLNREPALRLELLAVIPERPLDPQRRVRRPSRAVLVADWRAEERHHAVARVLVDRPLEAVDLRRDQLEAPVHDPVHLLRVELLRQGREPCDVREEHGDLSALPFEGRPPLQDLLGQVLGRVGDGGRRPPLRGRCRHRRGFRGGAWSGLEARAALAAEPGTAGRFRAALGAVERQGGPALAAKPVLGWTVELTARTQHGDFLSYTNGPP